SSRVSTYQGKWAGISGYVEPQDKSPLERAIKEIEEETGLNPSEIKLINSGEPLRIKDQKENRTWIVHPFLWNVKIKNIRLDWENVESLWIQPKELAMFETVPNLKETLERVMK
ncbi:MAG: NUDIX domain-containing protein, partial [Candidatus Helarchaeota archaeon]